MAIEHNLITDPNVHEPKGASTAAAGTQYVSDGAGSGSWIVPDPKGLSTAQNEQVLSKSGGVVDWVYPSGRVYGEMDIIANTLSQTLNYSGASRITFLSTDGNYVKCTGTNFPFSSSVADLITFDAANDQFVIQVAGDYKIDFWGSFLCTDANTFLSIKYAVNNTPPYSPQKLTGQSATAADVICLSAAGIVENLSIGDNISLYIAAWRATGSSTPVALEDGGMTITLLHEV